MNPAQMQLCRWMVMGQRRPWLTVDELTRRSKIPARRVRHVLWTMSARGYVEKGDDSYTGATFRLTTEGMRTLAAKRAEYAKKMGAGRRGTGLDSWKDRHHGPKRPEKRSSRVVTRKADPQAIKAAIRGGTSV